MHSKLKGNAAGRALRASESDYPWLNRPIWTKPDLIADNLPLEGRVARVPSLPRGPAASFNISGYHSVTLTNTCLFQNMRTQIKVDQAKSRSEPFFASDRDPSLGRSNPHHSAPNRTKSRITCPVAAKVRRRIFSQNHAPKRPKKPQMDPNACPVPRGPMTLVTFYFQKTGHKKSHHVSRQRTSLIGQLNRGGLGQSQSHTIRPSVFFHSKNLIKPNCTSLFLIVPRGWQVFFPENHHKP
jgi:hypothetical protein